MSNTGFLALPGHIQEIVLQGIDEEVLATREKIRGAEQQQPVDEALLKSLKNDVACAESLHSRLSGGQV